MRPLFVRHLVLVSLFLLSACSRDISVTTVLEDTGGLRPGDKVYLASREVGSVDGVEVTEQTPGFTIEISLYPEHAELVQANAVAYVPLESPPMVVLLNPTEAADPVRRGGRLKGLSPLGAAIWQASDAAAAASDFMESVARKVDAYFEGDEWERTRTQINVEIAELAADSKAIAEDIVEEFRLLVESLTEDAADGSHTLREDVTAIEGDIARLEAEGHEELASALRELLKKIEGMARSGPGKEAPEPARTESNT